MKKVELPVKHIISGATIKPSGTLLNPQSLDFFYLRYRYFRAQDLSNAVTPGDFHWCFTSIAENN